MAFEGERAEMFSRLDQEMKERAEKRKEAERDNKFDITILGPVRDGAVNPQDFVAAGVMTKAAVEADEAEVERYKKSPEYDPRGLREAAVLEAAVQQMFEIGVFGDVVKFVKKTCVFDDMRRGYDLYVDVGEGEERVLLGIDATVSINLENLQHKVERNVSAARRGTIGAVKYFVDMDGVPHAEQEMPRIILGANRREAMALRTALLEKPEALDEHEITLRFLEQMLNQLEFIASIAPERSTVKKLYSRAAERVVAMCKEKDLDPNELRQAFSDDVLANPQELLGS